MKDNRKFTKADYGLPEEKPYVDIGGVRVVGSIDSGSNTAASGAGPAAIRGNGGDGIVISKNGWVVTHIDREAKVVTVERTGVPVAR